MNQNLKAAATLGVLLPTRNTADSIAAHLESMVAWLDLADQIVAVDSFSSDGTLDLLRRHLAGRPAEFLSHPPGLYESWNFGLARLRTRYVYIATVGDAIERAGIEHLVETAERFDADVVLSRPRLLDAAGQVVTTVRWPIHNLLAQSPIRETTALAASAAFALTAAAVPEGLLGSSASNVYRTAHLQSCPFPADCGHAGDTAWALRYALRTRWAVTPRTFSTFVMHGSAAPATIPEDTLLQRLLDLAQQTCAEAGDLAATELAPQLAQLAADARTCARAQQQYTAYRRAPDLWIFKPRAWAARSRYHRARAACLAQRRAIRDQHSRQPWSRDSLAPA